MRVAKKYIDTENYIMVAVGNRKTRLKEGTDK